MSIFIVYSVVYFFKRQQFKDCFNYFLHDYSYLLSSFGVDPKYHDEYVLVLGAGGLVGSPLVQYLKSKNYKVLVVNGRNHLDLRKFNALSIFDNLKIKFCYFLAYEVGGAKYLQSPEIQDEMYQSNLDMMNSVFTWLENRKIKFVFCFIFISS